MHAPRARRLNNKNWVGQEAPVSAGAEPEFPAEFSRFGHGRGGTVYLGPTNCADGQSFCVPELQNKYDARNYEGGLGQGFRSSISVARLNLPYSGRIELGDTFKVHITRPSADAEVRTAAFDMPGEDKTDWRCHANWIDVQDTSEFTGDDEAFRTAALSQLGVGTKPPCVDDVAYFPPNSAFLVNVPERAALWRLYYGTTHAPIFDSSDSDANGAVRDRLDDVHQFALPSVWTDVSMVLDSDQCGSLCPADLSTVRDGECVGHCVDSCPHLLQTSPEDRGTGLRDLLHWATRPAALQGGQRTVLGPAPCGCRGTYPGVRVGRV